MKWEDREKATSHEDKISVLLDGLAKNIPNDELKALGKEWAIPMAFQNAAPTAPITASTGYIDSDGYNDVDYADSDDTDEPPVKAPEPVVEEVVEEDDEEEEFEESDDYYESSY